MCLCVLKGIPGENGYRGYPGDEGGLVSKCFSIAELLLAVARKQDDKVINTFALKSNGGEGGRGGRGGGGTLYHNINAATVFCSR